MASFNKVILLGNLTRDPALSFLPSQTAVCEFGLAVNRKWKDKDGQAREDVMFIDCRAYGKSAETLNQYVKKGAPLLVEGRLQFDTWEAKDGTKHNKHRVMVEQFQFVGGKDDAKAAPKPATSPTVAPPADAPPVDDDIPF